MTLHAISVLALAVLLAGCATSPEQLAQRNNERCAARGLKAGTDAFADCVVALETESDLRRQARHREMVERTSIPPMTGR